MNWSGRNVLITGGAGHIGSHLTRELIKKGAKIIVSDRKKDLKNKNFKKLNVIVRPIMYLALSYDHRIIDGKESVSFLKMIKENLEDPRRLFLDI